MAFDLRKTGLGCLVSLLVSFCFCAHAQLLPEDMIDAEELVEEIRYYSVEVIVFEYASNVSGGNEIFEPVPAEETGEPVPDAEIPLITDTAPDASDESDADAFGDLEDSLEEEVTELDLIPSLTDVGFRLLTEEELSMGEIHEKLDSLDAYQPVLWGGWVQSTLDREFSPFVRLRVLGMPPIHIDGTLKLYLKNYLHLVIDLTKEQQIASIQPAYRFERSSRDDRGSNETDDYYVADHQTIIYQIQEDRLFQSGQLRYYDHPKFGVLARVNRVEVADPEDNETEEEPSGRAMLSNIE